MKNNSHKYQMPDDDILIEQLSHFLQVPQEEAEHILETQSETILSDEVLELMRNRLALLERAYQQKLRSQSQLQSQPLEVASFQQPPSTSPFEASGELAHAQQPPQSTSLPEASPDEQTSMFLDDRDMAWTLQQMTSEHWDRVLDEIHSLHPEDVEQMIGIFQAQVGMTNQQAEQIRHGFAQIEQIDPEILREAMGKFSSEQLAQIGQVGALFFNAGNLQIPAAPPMQARGIPDDSQTLLMREMQGLPPSQQTRMLTLWNEVIRLVQLQEPLKLIDLYTGALDEFASTPTPYFRAMLRLERARVYLQALETNPRTFAEAGLADCNTALTVWTREETPVFWATAHALRGIFYFNLPTGIRGDNLERAIADFDAILQHFTYETLPGLWVMVRGTRGMTVQELHKGGRRQNVKQAITDIEAALEHLSYEETPELWAALKGACTQAHMLLYTHHTGDRTRTLEQIIQDCDDALKVVTRERLPREWALLHQTRGLAYTDRSSGDPRQNREQAIADCERALTIFLREREPYDWAATHMYLGNAYLFRAVGNRTQNLQEALKNYKDSLQVFTHETYPVEWGMAQSNYDLAAEELGQGDRQATQVRAMADYAEALAQIDRQTQPVAWATIHVNWGNSYLNRLQGERQTNMEQAIDHYNQALTVLTRDLSPMLWAMTLINRSMAKRGWLPQNLLNTIQSGGSGFMETLLTHPFQEMLGEIATWRRRMDGAIEDLQQALTVLTREDSPREWATAHRELANTYELYMWGNRQECMSKAREHLAAAQSILTSASTPQEWAVLQLNHGLGLLSRLSGSSSEHDARQILDHFDAALTVFIPEVAPANHRRVQLVRAMVLERLGRWEEAHQALLRAREVQRDLVASAMSEQGSDEAIAEIAYSNMYVHDAEVLLRMDPPCPAEAAIALEEGRAQSMRAALDMDNYARQKQQIRDPEVRKRLETFLATRNEWRAWQHRAIEPLPEGLSSSEEYQQRQRRMQALQDAYTAFVQARAAIRLHDNSDFMTPIPTLEAIARPLKGPDEALVYLATGVYLSLGFQPLTERTLVDGTEPGMALIVTRQMNGTDDTPQVQALSLPGMNTNAIDMLIQPASREKPASNALSEKKPELKFKPEGIIQTLGGLGLNELAAALYTRGVRKVILIPYGRLGLLPLFAVRVQIPERPACYLGDLFELTFAPSARAAEVARERAAACLKARPALLIGGNPQPIAAVEGLPDENLPFATAEADTVYRLARTSGYPSTRLHHLRPGEMSKDNVAARMREATYAHLALHGLYRVDDPRRSVLILAGTRETPEEKRTISLGEVLDGKIDLHNLRLLVLSACETSTFDVRRLPNEVIGLAAGFLQAGVAGVIASLWRVNDEATYLLMTRFARLYLDSQALWSPAQALTQAQRWLREEATNAVLQHYDPLPPGLLAEANSALSGEEYNHQAAVEYIRKKARKHAHKPDELPYADPFYWAGFVVTGY